jgi:hypothetical protein
MPSRITFLSLYLAAALGAGGCGATTEDPSPACGDAHWTRITSPLLTSSRIYHVAVRVQSGVVVWGGSYFTDSGARQHDRAWHVDVDSGEIRPLARAGAPVSILPLRATATATPDGREVLVWIAVEENVAAGGRYLVNEDRWEQLPGPSDLVHIEVGSATGPEGWFIYGRSPAAFSTDMSGTLYDFATRSWHRVSGSYVRVAPVSGGFLVWGGWVRPTDSGDGFILAPG